MTQDRLVAFRVDGGIRFGMGHLVKCVRLAQYLAGRDRNVRVLFFIKRDRRGIAWLKKQGVPVVLIPSGIPRSKESAWMLRRLGRRKKILFALDILDVSRRYVRTLKLAGHAVITFENTASSIRIADATVNALVQGLKNRLERFPEGGTVYVGSRYRILDPACLRGPRKIYTPSQNRAKKIVITTGGGPDKGFGAKLLRALRKIEMPFPIHALLVTGPAQSPTEMQRLFR